MQAVIGRVFLMIVLVAAGSGLWAAGQAEKKIADGHKRLATLQYAAAGTGTGELDASLRYLGTVPAAGESMRADVKEQRATAQYWLQQYGALEPERDASGAPSEHDPEVLFLAANAGYHTASKMDPKAREEAVRALETVMKSYVEVLKTSPGHSDAAYNYEFVSRRRTALAQPPARPVAGKPDTSVKADPETTIQGRPGAPPKAEFSQFKVVTPKQKEERDDPQAGRGETKIRKG